MKLKNVLGLSLLLVGSMLVSCGKKNDQESNNDNVIEENQGNQEQGQNQGNQEQGNQENQGNGNQTDSENQTGSGEVLEVGDVNITKCLGLNESGYVEWEKGNADSFKVYIKDNQATNPQYKLLTDELGYVREVSGKMRVDIMGIKSGSYDVKIAPVQDNQELSDKSSSCNIKAISYDRSGYAHFKNTEGVGAYNDDGTLKDNAIVIYVTDENKDTVMADIVNKYQDIDMFTIPGYNKPANGIGWWLNNTQYTKAVKDSSGNINVSKTSNTYSPTGQKLGFYSVTENHPLVIRFVGTVTSPEGLTAYNSVNEGGTVGDNGHMARMKDLKNVTLEGVGNDAIIKGWGFHFICSDKTNVRGKNFEARNLTFTEYPEDALGMEGVQEGNQITASVERCWVHHCTFLPGYCANPAESDKKEGDGSCDFKRGQYYTMSYCYYEFCHKTNLVGSSDTSLQYNISMHHNTWFNCGSRIPLLRKANIHFYNNLIVGDPEVSPYDLSYVTSLRAESYMYSEYNYYDGCKLIYDKKEGAAKSYNNMYTSSFNSPYVDTSTVLNREDNISNTCAYNEINYSSFDTNPDQFYYDPINKRSDCYLTDAYLARIECIQESGSLYRTELDKTALSSQKTTANKYDVEDSVDLTNKLTISQNEFGVTNIKGLVCNNVKAGKFKGQGITFRITSPATLTIQMTCSSTASLDPGSVIREDGLVVLNDSGTVTLEPGLYFVASCQKDKETTVTQMTLEKFDSAEFDQLRIDAYNELLNKLPNEILYNDECYQAINSCIKSYKNLSPELKEKVDYTKVTNAYNTYKQLGEKEVEALINNIGVVDKSSGTKITLAKEAYENLTSKCIDASVSNKNVLDDAIVAFKSFAIDSCIEKINAIGTVTLDSKEAIDLARNEYMNLDEADQALITNYDILVSAENTYTNLLAASNVDNLILAATDINSMKEAIKAYNELTLEQQSLVQNKALYSGLQVELVIKLIDSIGEVTNKSGALISDARSYYDTLNTDQMALVTNYSVLEAAESYFATLVVEYKASWSYLTEAVSTKEGTTKEGFTYKMNKVSENAMCIKKGSGQFIRSNELLSSKVNVTITMLMVDTSDMNVIDVLVTYTDGTTEIKQFESATGKAEKTVSIDILGKEVKYVEVIGSSTNETKNVGIKEIVVTYEK